MFSPLLVPLRRGNRKRGLFRPCMQAGAMLLGHWHQPLLETASVLIGRGIAPDKTSGSAKVTADLADGSSHGGDLPWR